MAFCLLFVPKDLMKLVNNFENIIFYSRTIFSGLKVRTKLLESPPPKRNYAYGCVGNPTV